MGVAQLYKHMLCSGRLALIRQAPVIYRGFVFFEVRHAKRQAPRPLVHRSGRHARATSFEVLDEIETFTMANRKKTITLGIAVAVAVLAIFVPVLMALPLFVVAALLIAWALQPEGTEAFIGRLPYGNYVLRALAKLELDAFRPELRPHGSRRATDGAPRAQPPQDPYERAKLQGEKANAQRHAAHSREASTAFWRSVHRLLADNVENRC